MRVLTVAPTSARPRPKTSEGRRIAVIDVDPIWESAAIEGDEVVVVSPEEDTAGALSEMGPARVVVNLAAAGALDAVAALRGAGSEAKVWGCIGLAGAERAIPVGIVEVAARPLDCDAILEILKGYTSRGTRVVTAGADVDTLMSLRPGDGAPRHVGVDGLGREAGDRSPHRRPPRGRRSSTSTCRAHAGYGILARLSLATPVPCAVSCPGRTTPRTRSRAALAQPGSERSRRPARSPARRRHRAQEALAADRRLQKDPRRRPKVAAAGSTSHGRGP